MQTVFHGAETAGHHEVQTAGTVMLVLETAVARFPELIQEAARASALWLHQRMGRRPLNMTQQWC